LTVLLFFLGYEVFHGQCRPQKRARLQVTVKPASGKGSSKSAHADDNGYAKFWVDTGVEYTIEAKNTRIQEKSFETCFHCENKAVFAHWSRADQATSDLVHLITTSACR